MYLVWFQGRTTAKWIANADSRSQAISKARKSGVEGSDGPVEVARKATSEELKSLRKGIWLRTRPHQEPNTTVDPTKGPKTKFGTKIKADR